MGAGKDDGERRRRSRGQLWGRSQAGAVGTTGYEGHGAQRDPRVIALPACATSPLCTRAMPGRGHRGASSSEVTGRVGSAASLYTSGTHGAAPLRHPCGEGSPLSDRPEPAAGRGRPWAQAHAALERRVGPERAA